LILVQQQSAAAGFTRPAAAPLKRRPGLPAANRQQKLPVILPVKLPGRRPGSNLTLALNTAGNAGAETEG
jgi:hypothetical protein